MLVIRVNFEASGMPVHKLDGALGLDSGDGSTETFGSHVSTVQQAASHVDATVKLVFHHVV